jgi:hypothetical protein
MNETDYQYGEDTSGASATSYVFAAIELLLVWYTTALLVGLLMLVVTKPDHPGVIGIGCDLVHLPGTILGGLTGLRSARARLRGPRRKRKTPSP